MTTSSIRDRGLAILAGGVFLAGTCGILFEDVILKSAPITLKHYLTLAVLTGTILAGHLANDARRGRHWLATIGFSAVFLFGTLLVVYSSVGRQAADTIQTTAQIEADAQRRIESTKARARSQDMLDAAQADLAKECKSGKGKRCEGIKSTIEVYTAAISGHNATLASLGAPAVASADAEQFAEVVHVVFGADKAKVKAGAVLVVPFLVAVFLEFGVIVSLGFGFRHGPAPARLVAPDRPVTQSSDADRVTDFPAISDDEIGNVIPFFRPDNDRPGDRPGPSGPRKPAPSAPDGSPDGRKDEVLAALLTDLALGRTFGTQREMQDRYGVERSTMSDWLREWEAAGLIPTRRTVGRRKELTKA